MGMESFYVSASIKPGLAQKEFLDFIKTKYRVEYYKAPIRNILFKRKFMDKNRFVINREFILSVNYSNDIELTLEACFANFEVVLHDLFLFLVFLKKQFDTISFYRNEDIYLSSMEEENFKKWVVSLYKDKYNYFIHKYGKINKTLLPSYFYKGIKFD